MKTRIFIFVICATVFWQGVVAAADWTAAGVHHADGSKDIYIHWNIPNQDGVSALSAEGLSDKHRGALAVDALSARGG